MASASLSSKPPCATCGNKSVGVFKCEGCLQTFCRKHSNEHRDSLSHQLDEIVLEHDTLQQTIVEQKEKQSDRHHLIEHIDKWGKESIVKIQKTAEDARQQVETFIAAENDTVSSKLYDLAQRLRKAREDDDFVETDLRLWAKKLQELKIDITNVHPTITIREDPSMKLIAKLDVTSITQQPKQNESLVGVRGDIQIQNEGRVAIQRSSGTSYISGRNEYSFGRYKIRLNVNKVHFDCDIYFGITSKKETFSAWPSSFCGWSSDDVSWCGELRVIDKTNFKGDLNGKTSFTIELVLECDNRKIQYFNEQTKNSRELNVDQTQCPFPWQIFFYLYSPGDRVQLL